MSRTVRAVAKTVGLPARKVRFVLDEVRGKDIEYAFR